MSENEGYIKLYRQILDNPVVCKDSDHIATWVFLLSRATYKNCPAIFNGKKIILNPGQLITGRKKISEKFSISESKVQRILHLFEKEHQIEQQTCNKNRLITIVEWHKYQSTEQQAEQQPNNKRTTTEQQLNTNKKDKNKEKEKKDIYGEYGNVRLSAEDMEKLTKEFPTDWRDRIERLSEYMASTGRTYKSHLATIRAWSRKEKHDNAGKDTGTEKPQEKPGNGTDKYATFFKA